MRKNISKAFVNEYKNADKLAKSDVLNHLVATTGWNRKYAISKITKAVKVSYKRGRKPLKKPVYERKKIYDGYIQKYLIRIWVLSGFPNSKSLKQMMPYLIDKFNQFNEWGKTLIPPNEDETKLLNQMSSFTIEKLLKKIKDKLRLKKGKSLTKAGTLLRNSIKVRKAIDEMEFEPGFIETDTVAHCGNTLQGEFIRTVTATDVYTSWTENIAVRNNAHMHIIDALNKIDKAFPNKIKGIDSDNGSEFINEWVVSWANDKKLYFTRSRPYKKNDNSHVEQKNNDIVRRLAFYYRYDTSIELHLLNKLYKLSSDFYNYFRAVQKATGWREVKKGKKQRVYDTPNTPLNRVLESNVLNDKRKQYLLNKYERLNPVSLQRKINNIQQKLIRLAGQRQKSIDFNKENKINKLKKKIA